MKRVDVQEHLQVVYEGRWGLDSVIASATSIGKLIIKLSWVFTTLTICLYYAYQVLSSFSARYNIFSTNLSQIFYFQKIYKQMYLIECCGKAKFLTWSIKHYEPKFHWIRIPKSYSKHLVHTLYFYETVSNAQ